MARCARARSAAPCLGLLASLAAAVLPALPAAAGNGANYILYNQRTAEQGETEVKLYSDISSGPPGEQSYGAQLLEIEHGFTDNWTASLDLEGDKISGEGYAYGGLRIENRWRPFAYGTFLNPVLYAEYEQLRPEHRYIHGVTGRVDDEAEDNGDGGTEYELETRLILAEDLNRRLNVAFNWINDTNLVTGRWEFGYAGGINYVLFKHDGQGPSHGSRDSWHVEEAVLGVELYGGLGDATLGLTLDPHQTQQYLGVNLLFELENNLELGIGGAFGLTGPSEDALLRTQVGYKIE